MSALTSKKSFIKPRTFLSAGILSVLLNISVTAYADVTYGPVQSRDTLGKIVNRFYSGANRSMISLMKTIVANNPQAFVRGNMNLLKKDALLVLPGNEWLVNDSRFVSGGSAPEIAQQRVSPQAVSTPELLSDARDVPVRSPQQMQDRIIFLEAERISLISQVEELKRDTVRLEAKIKQLESQSGNSDDQLRVLDREIIRLTELLNAKGTSAETVVVSQADLSQLSQLQEKLESVQRETESLRGELSKAKTELSNNTFLKSQADQTIAQLTQENSQLQHLLKESQPGVHYFGETNNSSQLSFLGGKLNLPSWVAILGGALFSLIMISLLATRRGKRNPDPEVVEQVLEKVPPVDINTYDTLLESSDDELERGFAQTSNRPEENVFKMFDEGSLEMDLKLDMAEAYLQVSDFESAKAVLQEVMEGGSELQQRKATRLLKKAA